MELSFLEQESKRGNAKARKMLLISLTVFLVCGGIVAFALLSSLDLNNYDDKKLLIMLSILAAVMLFFEVFGLIKTSRTATNGKNLILPFKEDSKENIAAVINKDACEGGFLVDEYIYNFSDGKKPYGEKVILTPTYLLICNGMGKVTAIPREKIYWLCAQVGRKGSSSFVVRLLVFTETKTFTIDGVDVEHVKLIAEKLYNYIPNVFKDYDPFILSYQLEALYEQNRAGFIEFLESEKNKNETAAK